MILKYPEVISNLGSNFDLFKLSSFELNIEQTCQKTEIPSVVLPSGFAMTDIFYVPAVLVCCGILNHFFPVSVTYIHINGAISIRLNRIKNTFTMTFPFIFRYLHFSVNVLIPNIGCK